MLWVGVLLKTGNRLLAGLKYVKLSTILNIKKGKYRRLVEIGGDKDTAGSLIILESVA